MENITSAIELKNAIQRLKVEQAINEQLLRDQFCISFESLKPINLLKSTIYDFTTSPHLTDGILGTATGLLTGYLSRKIVTIGASGNLIRKLLGTVLQFGVTNVVSQNPETIKSIGQYIYQHTVRKKRNEI